MTSSKLSPAAQIVWDAAWQLSPVNCESHEDRRRQQIAAALRAAADRLSQEVDAPKVDGSKYAGIWHGYDYLNAIADELEAN